MVAGSEELLSQLTSSAVVIYVIQALKRSSWFPWVTTETKRLNRWLAVLGSAASAAGIHLAYDGTLGTILITGVTTSGIAHGLWHWFQQYALTQLAYDATIDNKYVPKAGDLAITEQPAPPVPATPQPGEDLR